LLGVRDLFDDFFVDFDAFEVNVGLEKFVVIVKENGCVDHRAEADSWDADGTKVTGVSAAGENLHFRFEVSES
jgi:hypothetical protein